jgi:hypothetical protein
MFDGGELVCSETFIAGHQLFEGLVGSEIALGVNLAGECQFDSRRSGTDAGGESAS